jgi:hypothetical protein
VLHEALVTQPSRWRPSRRRVHAGGRQEQLLGEIDAPHRAVLGVGEREQALVVRDREAVVREQPRVELARQRGVRAQQLGERVDAPKCLMCAILD